MVRAIFRIRSMHGAAGMVGMSLSARLNAWHAFRSEVNL